MRLVQVRHQLPLPESVPLAAPDGCHLAERARALSSGRHIPRAKQPLQSLKGHALVGLPRTVTRRLAKGYGSGNIRGRVRTAAKANCFAISLLRLSPSPAFWKGASTLKDQSKRM